MLYGDIPVFTYHITFPSFSTTCDLAAAQTINAYYMHLAGNTEQYCRTVLRQLKAPDISLSTVRHLILIPWICVIK